MQHIEARWSHWIEQRYHEYHDDWGINIVGLFKRKIVATGILFYVIMIVGPLDQILWLAAELKLALQSDALLSESDLADMEAGVCISSMWHQWVGGEGKVSSTRERKYIQDTISLRQTHALLCPSKSSESCLAVQYILAQTPTFQDTWTIHHTDPSPAITHNTASLLVVEFVHPRAPFHGEQARGSASCEIFVFSW